MRLMAKEKRFSAQLDRKKNGWCQVIPELQTN